MKFDEILTRYVGEFGLYQKIQFILVSLPTLFTAMHSLSWTFTGGNIPYRCLLMSENGNDFEPFMVNNSYYQLWLYGGNTTDKIKHGCESLINFTNNARLDEKPFQTEQCKNGYKWDTSEITNTAFKKWEMVCSRKWLKSFVQSMYYVGQFFGSVVFGILADKIGRKKVFVMAILTQVICGTAMAYIPYWPLFALFRLGLGLSHPGIFMMAVVICVELVGPSRRVLSSVSAGIFFAIGEIILGSCAYGIRDYQHLQLVISLPALLFLVYWWIVPESARWLISRKRFDEAGEILNKIAAKNKKTLPLDWQKNLDAEVKNLLCMHVVLGFIVLKGSNPGVYLKPTNPVDADKKYGVIDLIRTPNIRKRTIICFICWPTVSMAYYGLAMNPSFFGGSLYVSFIVGACLEIVAVCFVLFIVQYIGRKMVCTGGFVLASLCLFLTLAIPDNLENIRMIFVIVGKMLLTAVYCIVYVITPELFPTSIRSTAMGMCSMIARVGATSASYISFWLADILGPVAVAVIFGSLCFIAGVSAIFLPETTGQSQLETVEEAEAFGTSQNLFEIPWRNKKLETVADNKNTSITST